MKIHSKHHSRIQSIDVNAHSVDCDYTKWRKQFKNSKVLKKRLSVIEDNLGSDFCREDLASFYRSRNDIETKFLATMIWGHEAPPGGRRDNRGPWKVLQMFKSLNRNRNLLSSISINSDSKLTDAYRLMDKNINRCGPSFFTKHFYFLGRSRNHSRYPLIFDNRVALGIVKLFSAGGLTHNMVTVGAATRPDAYIDYLNFAYDQASRIGCEAEQIEYFLFDDMARA
jgi:hypothetical protein